MMGGEAGKWKKENKMRITTNFKGIKPGNLGTAETQEENLNKIGNYINQAIEYFESFIRDMSGMSFGIVSGGEITEGVGLQVNAGEIGNAWIAGISMNVPASVINLNDDATNYIYINHLGEYEVYTEFTYYNNKIPRGVIVTESGGVVTIVEYPNKIFTISEMVKLRMTPMGASIYNDGENSYLSVSYLDPAQSGATEIVVEGYNSSTEEWEEVDTINLQEE